MAEAPPLNRIYVFGYSANERDYPIVSLTADPRVAGYQVPKDLSACPDKRYPNHVFTGAQPISGDQRVRHVWEILPSPWVPFTRYDDDLGPVQGRRRSVKNEGQVASLTADKRTTYEAREGSAIVYTELEETWSIKTDEDGNSLFPIRDRDFYDPSRGPVQERRQLFVPTGEEEGSLENVNGVITQTSYEPYNEFLSVKIVQTYKVDGPQLVGSATDNDRQPITITTQRKAAEGYVPPLPSATRTVEANREDVATVVERIVDGPVFPATTLASERPDPIPAKFKASIPTTTSEQNIAGTAQTPSLQSGDISKSEQQVNSFVKRISSTFRSLLNLPRSLTQKATNNEGQLVTITETLQNGDTAQTPTAKKTVESEALGDGTYVVTTREIPKVFGSEVFRKSKEDLTPQKFRGAQEEVVVERNEEGVASANITINSDAGEFSKSEQQVTEFVKRVSTSSRSTTPPAPITEYILTQQGQIGTRTLTLDSAPQSFSPSATLIDANVESLGDGRTVKTEVRIPEVFPNKTITKTKTDLTPEKFKAKQEETTTEESVAGTIATNLVLDSGEFGKSEQQVTEFVKRVSTTKRETDISINLNEVVVTPQRQLAQKTIRLSSEPQSIQPDARLIDGSIEELGDGRTIKTEVRVDETFDSLTVSAQKPDTIPEKFRANATTKRTEKTVEKTSAEENPELLENEYSKIEQRLTEFTVQQTTIERESVLNETGNQRLEENWGIPIPYKEYISDSIPSGDNYEGEGLDDKNHLVREYNKTELDAILSSFSVTIPTSIDLDLPRILKNITVTWRKEKAKTENNSDTTGLAGQFKSLTQEDGGTIESDLSLIPNVELEFEDIWGKNLPAQIHLFFLKKESLNDGAIRSKIGASASWPVFKPKSFYTTVFGKSEKKTIVASISRAMQINDTPLGYGFIPSKSWTLSSRIALTPISINIPTCLCAGINVNNPETLTADPLNINIEFEPVKTSVNGSIEPVTTSVNGSTIIHPAVAVNVPMPHTLECDLAFNVPATVPADIPRSGRYLISSSAEPYKFGWFLVRAISLDAAILA